MVFLAGVATATIMDGDKIVATANTLLDSSITIGVSMEDVRAGVGNKLFGRYAHTSTMDLKLTDAMFNLQYLAMNTGSNVEMGGDVFKNEKLTANASGEITLSESAVEIGKSLKAYAFKSGTNDKYEAYDVTGEDSKTVVGLTPDTEYCVRYAYHNNNASRIVISSNFIPKTLSVILEANLYSGGSCDVETSTLAGKLQIKVYRFMLNGNQELSMTAAGVSQTSIEGSALSSGCEGCDGDGAYAEIIQIMENEHWYDKAAGIMVEDSYQEIAAGSTSIPLNVYAYFTDASPMKLGIGDYSASITPELGLSVNNGVVTGTATQGTAVVKVVAQGMEASMTLVIS